MILLGPHWVTHVDAHQVHTVLDGNKERKPYQSHRLKSCQVVDRGRCVDSGTGKKMYVADVIQKWLDENIHDHVNLRCTNLCPPDYDIGEN